MNDLKRGLLGSLQKWREICNNELDVFEAEEQCTLCEEFLYCINCPLNAADNGCREGSTWDRISNLLCWYGTYLADEFWDGIGEDEMVTLEMLDNEEITKECNKMLSIIEGLCKKEGF